MPCDDCGELSYDLHDLYNETLCRRCIRDRDADHAEADLRDATPELELTYAT
jgi:hypothetical protein